MSENQAITQARQHLETFLTAEAQRRGCSPVAAKGAAEMMMRGAEISPTGTIALRVDGRAFDLDTLDEGVVAFLERRSYFRDQQRAQETPAAGSGGASADPTVKGALESLSELRGGGVPSSQEFFQAGLAAPLPAPTATPAKPEPLPEGWKDGHSSELFAAAGFGRSDRG